MNAPALAVTELGGYTSHDGGQKATWVLLSAAMWLALHSNTETKAPGEPPVA